MKELRIDLHSFSIYRNGRTVFSKYGYPFTAESMHRMYSAGKMLVALAVVKAVEERKLRLEDKAISFFENTLPGNLDSKYQFLTVRHMLTMNTGHDHDTMQGMRAESDWIHGFFRQEPAFMPGTKIFYNNGVPYILTQIVRKVTGLDYLDYLKLNFFDDMNIYITADKNANGDTDPSGISIRIRDFEKLPVLLLNHGVWNGRQLIGAEYIDLLGQYQTPSIQDPGIKNVNIDTKYGYGFLLWRNSVGGYRLDGGRGQYGLVFPDLGMAILVMSFEEDQGLILELIWEYLYPSIWNGPVPLQQDYVGTIAYQALPQWKEVWHDTSGLHRCTYQCVENEIGLEQIYMEFQDDRILFKLIQNQKHICFAAGLKGNCCVNKEFIRWDGQNWFMDHVTGNADQNYYIAGKYELSDDFMQQPEISLYVRCLAVTNYLYCTIRAGKGGIRIELAHGSWNCVKMRGRLELLPHIKEPVLIYGEIACRN